MTYKVVLTRQRTIEERINAVVTVPNEVDAIAVTNHLIDSGIKDWKYNRTLQITTPTTAVIPSS